MNMRFFIHIFTTSLFFIIAILNELDVIKEIQNYYFFLFMCITFGYFLTGNEQITNKQKAYYKYLYGFWIIIMLIVFLVKNFYK
jgi:hypothetical protein